MCTVCHYTNKYTYTTANSAENSTFLNYKKKEKNEQTKPYLIIKSSHLCAMQKE